MNYYSDKENQVFAYDDEQLSQVSRLSELEFLIQEKEPNVVVAKNNVEQITLELDEAKALLESITENAINSDEDNTTEINEEIQNVKLIVADKTTQLEDATAAFNQIESECKPLIDEFNAVLPVFFDIREHLKVLKKMTDKEIDMHINPPISKAQLIAEAEQKKQTYLVEANGVIAPLQDAIDLDMATGEEKAQLTAWKAYRVLLNRVDTSLAPDIDWPIKP